MSGKRVASVRDVTDDQTEKANRVDCCMVTSRHRCDDSRVLGLEARSLTASGFSVAWVGPEKGSRHEDERVEYRLFDPECSGLRRMYLLLKSLWATPARVYHCHEPDALVLVLLIAKPRGSKVIFDAHEFYRAYAYGRAPRGLKNLASAAYFLFELVAYRLCDHLITVSDGVAHEMAKAVSGDMITVVANCSGPSVFLDRPRALPPAAFRILHLGTASYYHQLKEMIEAFLIVSRRIPDAEFLQLGRVPSEELEWLRSFGDAHGLQQMIRYVPRVPFEDLAGYIPCADVGLIARTADENADIGFPTKLFDYMTFGVPIVGTDLTMIRRLNRTYRVAVLVNTENPEEIADGILELYNNPQLRETFRRNALKAVRTEYSWDHMSKRMIGVYGRVLGRLENRDSS